MVPTTGGAVYEEDLWRFDVWTVVADDNNRVEALAAVGPPGAAH
ncbi:MAG: hypothetical protein VYC13_10165 [Actinomycetota bacterium]|nr:hypothetical protein [Actinomycetota bacterium]MEC9426944.1 hypothetical protein [Actinomycetota bacterium]MEC9449686.1 hypothetical protein [Actinomycetota bacterium]MED5167691.1 hypothetical protein [Actinomycetota bacterium]